MFLQFFFRLVVASGEMKLGHADVVNFLGLDYEDWGKGPLTTVSAQNLKSWIPHLLQQSSSALAPPPSAYVSFWSTLLLISMAFARHNESCSQFQTSAHKAAFYTNTESLHSSMKSPIHGIRQTSFSSSTMSDSAGPTSTSPEAEGCCIGR